MCFCNKCITALIEKTETELGMGGQMRNTKYQTCASDSASMPQLCDNVVKHKKL